MVGSFEGKLYCPPLSSACQWLAALYISSDGLSSMCVCVQTSSPYKYNSTIGLEPTLINSFSLDYLSKNSVDKKLHSEGLEL